MINLKKIMSDIKLKYLEFKYSLISNKLEPYKTIDGWLNNIEALTLYSIASKLPENGKILEIGSWKGKSTFCLAQGLKKGKIYAIDPFNASGEESSINEYQAKKGDTPLLNQFIENMTNLGVIDKIEVKKGYSIDFKDDIQEIDFLFIDGDHSVEGCKLDYDLYANKLKKYGYIALHDFNANRDNLGPTWVVKNLIEKSNKYKFLGLYGSLWLAKKIK